MDCCGELKEEGYGYVKPIDEILTDGKHKIEKYFIFLFLITDLNVKWFQNVRFLLECSLAKIHVAFVYIFSQPMSDFYITKKHVHLNQSLNRC